MSVMMYSDDSFFTLTNWGQAGLAGLSILFSIGLLILARCVTKGRRLWVRCVIAFALFWLFVWVSPQLYYAYYRTIIDGLPLQWVIGWPEPLEALRYLSFSGTQTLSAHGQAFLGWTLLLVAALRR